MKKTQQVQTQSVGAAVQQNKQFYQNCVNKWKKLLVSEHVAPIENKHTRAVTAVLLENQANALMEVDAGTADAAIIDLLMAGAMKKAVEAGREAFLAGRMPRKFYSADPSSPTTGLIGS